jgi:hypothetical protein
MGCLGLPRDIQQINPHKDDQETADERKRVGSVGRVETLKQDRRRNDGGGGEKDVVYRVHVGGEGV